MSTIISLKYVIFVIVVALSDYYVYEAFVKKPLPLTRGTFYTNVKN